MIKKILYIDDDQDQIAIMKFWFEDRDFKFIAASNGEEGIKKAGEEMPDLVVTDLHMPDIRGDQVVKSLKENSKTCAIPVILMTASEDLNSEELRLCGAKGMVEKTEETDRLFSLIQALLF